MMGSKQTPVCSKTSPAGQSQRPVTRFLVNPPLQVSQVFEFEHVRQVLRQSRQVLEATIV